MKYPITLFFICITALFAGCISDNGKLPQPTVGFTPKHTYAVPYDKLWSGVLDALDKNRITTISVDKASGVISTDYIAGPENFLVFAAQSTRYKYNIALRNQSDGSIKMNIVCKVESSLLGQNGSSQWNDVSPQNTGLVTKAETWLYEQIEKEIQ
jgi:hypothetical protein